MSFVDAPEFSSDAQQKDGAHPRFYMDVQPDKASSEREGRPCFRDVEMVEVLVPGDRLNTPHFQVTDVHRKRWPRHYAAFRENQEAPVQGTPIDQLPGITKSRVEELKYFHVRTIEQLAAMPDDLLKKAAPMDGFALREKAQRWVTATEGNAPAEKLAAENRALKDKMEAMEKNQASMQAAVDRLNAQLEAAASGPGSQPQT